jgi:hypothetical protein
MLQDFKIFYIYINSRVDFNLSIKICRVNICKSSVLTELAVAAQDCRLCCPSTLAFNDKLFPNCQYNYSASVPVVGLDLKENFEAPKLLAGLQTGITGSHLWVYIYIYIYMMLTLISISTISPPDFHRRLSVWLRSPRRQGLSRPG